MYGYEELVDVIWLQNLQMRLEYWFMTEILVWSNLAQIVAIVVSIALCNYISKITNRHLRARITRLKMTEKGARLFYRFVVSITFPVIVLCLLIALRVVAQSFAWPVLILTTMINLTLVWTVIRLASWVIRNEAVSRFVAIAAFTVATLDILNLLEPTLLYLDQIGLRVGGTHLSALDVLKGAVSLAVFGWIAIVTSRLLEQRVHRARSLTPSLKLLTGKILKVMLIFVAILFALNSIGIDLTAFAVFTGAVGVGVGFGLQKPISNVISGVILLLDRSIKPGDVVELIDPTGGGDRTFGWVTALNARYASLTTRDGKEWLIPNEDLITNRVINWSFSDNRLRLLTPFGISYDSDVRKAIRLTVEAAKENPRVLKDPAPVCRLMGFGDSSVEMELRIWINDPANGIVNVRSEILLAMWDKFHEHGIRIPFPQRDLHIKGDSELTVMMDRPRRAAAA